jgi:hypothetical protein
MRTSFILHCVVTYWFSLCVGVFAREGIMIDVAYEWDGMRVHMDGIGAFIMRDAWDGRHRL